jgi:hypothetical protein
MDARRSEQDAKPALPWSIRGKPAIVLLNVVIGILLLAVGYLSHDWIRGGSPAAGQEEGRKRAQRVVQLDILNGCGVSGAAARFTDFLRTCGFDVVEARNYKTFNIPRTLVVDRVGDLAAARQVAAAIGVSQKNIIQQINPDYFVDVSVIIGEDYQNLRTSR